MPRSNTARRLALIALGVVLGLCVLEAGLQVAALALRLSGQQLQATWLTGRKRILCLGDSNTYGLYLADRAEAYPQQLERLWNETVETPRIEVLNLGYPGTNSSRLRRDLPRMLETFRPDVVVIMVGSNDYWTAPVRTDESGVTNRVTQFVTRHSRLYQLVYMLRRAFDRRRLEVIYKVKEDGGRSGTARFGDVEFEMGWKKASRRPDHDARLLANLGALADSTRAFGAEPVFMTYPSRMWNYGDAGRLTRAAAAASGVRLIDLASVFEPLCPREPCPRWLYPDHHPTADGYRKIAETLIRELREQP